jgi:hypothetical protein
MEKFKCRNLYSLFAQEIINFRVSQLNVHMLIQYSCAIFSLVTFDPLQGWTDSPNPTNNQSNEKQSFFEETVEVL